MLEEAVVVAVMPHNVSPPPQPTHAHTGVHTNTHTQPHGEPNMSERMFSTVSQENDVIVICSTCPARVERGRKRFNYSDKTDRFRVIIF